MRERVSRNPKTHWARVVVFCGIVVCLGSARSSSAQGLEENSRDDTPIASGRFTLSGSTFGEFESDSTPRITLPKPALFSADLIRGFTLGIDGSLISSKSFTFLKLPLLSAAHLPRVKNEPVNRFHWRDALLQSLFFLGLQHGFRLVTQSSTRAELKGPFFQDYLDSVSHLRGWRDGDSTLVNYVGHGTQGAVSGFIQIQNDPAGRIQEFSWTNSYRTSRLKAALWNMCYSIQFEIGPISESAIGNVGLHPNANSKHPQAYVDLVITPVMGTIWLVGEDIVDKYFISKLELKTDKRVLRALVRSSLNPARSFANLMRIQVPWFRDTRDPTVRW
jgi:hypothetical protein